MEDILKMVDKEKQTKILTQYTRKRKERKREKGNGEKDKITMLSKKIQK